MRLGQLRRREFITLLGGAAAAWPLAAHAQQADRMRRIGVLMNVTSDNPASQVQIAAFQQGLQAAGWSVGRNLRIDTRWSGGDVARLQKDAAELIALGPDLVVAGVGPTTQALQRASRTIPIVMAQSVDPVGAGFVASLARPGGNTTGFMQFEYGLSGKWLELLREIAPQVTRIGVIRDHETGAGSGSVVGIAQWAVIQAFASPLGVELSPINLRVAQDIEREMAAFAQERNGGLIVVVNSVAIVHHELIASLAARHRLPAIYPYRFYVEAGGLVSYGPNLVEQYRRAAAYVDRILKGEKPADLPVQAPTKYELAINLKTAKALGLDVPPMLLARADEVIE
jgi:putative tryptophan/tyrosine transport system substrate-binding protein